VYLVVSILSIFLAYHYNYLELNKKRSNQKKKKRREIISKEINAKLIRKKPTVLCAGRKTEAAHSTRNKVLAAAAHR
jgi:hypothetical protein